MALIAVAGLLLQALVACHALLVLRWAVCCTAAAAWLSSRLAHPGSHPRFLAASILMELWEALGEAVLLVWSCHVMLHDNGGCMIWSTGACHPSGAAAGMSLMGSSGHLQLTHVGASSVDKRLLQPAVPLAAQPSQQLATSRLSQQQSSEELQQWSGANLMLFGQLSWHLHASLKHIWDLGSNAGIDGMVHHLSTVALLAAAQPLGVQRPAVLALVLFGGTNPLLHLSKAAHYLGLSRTPKRLLFCALAATYFVLRVVLVPCVLLPCTWNADIWEPAVRGFAHTVLNVLLTSLYGLNLVWFWRLVGMITSGKVDGPVTITVQESEGSTVQRDTGDNVKKDVVVARSRGAWN